MMQVFNFESECVIKTFELIQGRQEGATTLAIPYILKIAVLLCFLMFLDQYFFFLVHGVRQIRSNIIYHFEISKLLRLILL